MRAKSDRRRFSNGFTLVEILIVVIILGILAAIAIPQFSNAGQESRKSSLMGQLKTLRSQISLYKIQHNDMLPDLVASQWTQFLGTTNLSGTIDTTAAGAFGPYIIKVPVNPLNSYSQVASSSGGANVGWVYNAATGSLQATNQTVTLLFNEANGTVQ